MQYNNFVFSEKDFSRFSFWQTPIWKNILEKSAQAKEVFYVWNPNSTFFLVEIRSVGAGFFGAFILGVKNFQICADFQEIMQDVEKILREKNCIFVQFEPLESSEILEKYFSHQKNHTIIKKFLMPFTRVVSLKNTAQEILANMPQKGRYAVRNAEKQGVSVQFFDTVQEEYLDKWMELLGETTKRDNFSHNSRAYYAQFFQESSGKMIVSVADYKEKTVAMAISVFSWKDAVYYYGASTSDPEGRKVSASYLLLWKTMELAREKWYENYDLLGVADPKNPNDPLLWVSQFKQKLGGELVELPAKFLHALSWKFFIFSYLQKMRKMWKK